MLGVVFIKIQHFFSFYIISNLFLYIVYFTVVTHISYFPFGCHTADHGRCRGDSLANQIVIIEFFTNFKVQVNGGLVTRLDS